MRLFIPLLPKAGSMGISHRPMLEFVGIQMVYLHLWSYLAAPIIGDSNRSLLLS